MKNETEQNIIDKQPSKWKFKLTAVLIFLFIISALVLSWFDQEPKSDPDSEAEIRQAAGVQLNKDPNVLTNADFGRINTLIISGKRLSDIKMLEKFTNLKVLMLDLSSSYAIPENTPRWKLILEKMGFIKIPKKYRPPWVRKAITTIDIKPLTKLKYLQTLSLTGMKIIDNRPLARLANLKELSLVSIEITDLEPLSKLKNLETLKLLYNEKLIIDLKPLKKLTNLKSFSYTNINREQIDDLRKALPDLKIYFGAVPFEQVLITIPSNETK